MDLPSILRIKIQVWTLSRADFYKIILMLPLLAINACELSAMFHVWSSLTLPPIIMEVKNVSLQ